MANFKMRQGSILTYLRPQVESTGLPVPKLIDAAVAVEQHGKQSVVDGSSNHDAQTPLPRKNSLTQSNADIKLQDPKATITIVQKTHLDRLRTVTATLLPVRYSDKFFAECIDQENDLIISFVAMYDSKAVGWIRCRVDPFPNEEKMIYYQIYIQALGILAPYRGLGLASALLQSAIGAREQRKYDVRSVYAHVWETNEDALEWYEKRGFKRVLLQSQYYRRLKPPGAWIVRKELT